MATTDEPARAAYPEVPHSADLPAASLSAPPDAAPGSDGAAGWPGVAWAQPSQPPSPPLPAGAGLPEPVGSPYRGPIAVARPPAKPSAMPDGPREYQQLLRGPRQRWWKPPLAIAMFLGCAVVVINLLSLLIIPLGAMTGHRNLLAYMQQVLDTKKLGPVGFAFLNLSLIVLIPSALFTVWAVFRTRPRFLISVEGRFRWRWFSRCLVVLVPLWIVYLGAGTLIAPPSGGRPPHWIALMIIVIVSTPLQAAGEEFAFRGFLTQVIGSWFRRPLASLLVAMPFSVGLFALAHGSLHLWVLVDLGSFALACYVLLWRTGGLEAGIALHAVNNVLLMLLSLNLGGWQQGFVESDTTGSPGSALISLAVNAGATALILWQAKRVKLQRVYRPVQTAPPAEHPVLSRP